MSLRYNNFFIRCKHYWVIRYTIITYLSIRPNFFTVVERNISVLLARLRESFPGEERTIA